jgi:hypothetical protein
MPSQANIVRSLDRRAKTIRDYYRRYRKNEPLLRKALQVAVKCALDMGAERLAVIALLKTWRTVRRKKDDDRNDPAPPRRPSEPTSGAGDWPVLGNGPQRLRRLQRKGKGKPRGNR